MTVHVLHPALRNTLGRVQVKLGMSMSHEAKPEPETVMGFIDPPMEISRNQLSGLNMMDETIIVREPMGPR